MNERVIKARALNKAIVNKVDKILDNTDHICEIKITIRGHSGEAPEITYEISELIGTEAENPK